MKTQTSDVLVIGCGPTGLVLAHLLGQFGVRVDVLEREPAVYPTPRATHIDEETLRNFQTTGTMARLAAHTCPFGKVDIVDEKGKVLFEDIVTDPDTIHGYEGSRFFNQVAFEQILRDDLKRFSSVSLHLGTEARSLADDGDGVTVHAWHLEENKELCFQATWVVGCDGGRSFTRESVGIEMESLAPKRKWLIVDTILKDMADAALLPDRFRYVLHPERLTIFAYGIGPNRRWEFALGLEEEVPDETELQRWIAPFIAPERLDFVRSVPYTHNSLVAKQWRKGRVFLAGDAAHMMPPSAGQGMCSGVRDAINLAWKLQQVLAGRSPDALLDTYEQERNPHVRDILAGTLVAGNTLKGDSAFQRWWRKQQLKLLKSIPPLQTLLRSLIRRRPHLTTGCLDAASPLNGHPFPQPLVQRMGEKRLLDDFLGYQFALLIKAEQLTTHLTHWSQQRNIGLWRPGADFVETEGMLSQWMEKHKLDFVLVRPDHQIFGAGPINHLPQVQASFDAWRC